MAPTDTQAASQPSLVRRLTSLLVTVAVQLAVFVVLLEMVARVADPIGISYYSETARLFDAMIVEEPIGYRFPPGLDDTFNGVPVKINDLGMRDRPVLADKAPGEFRILAMGDSVIFSVGVPVTDSIPRQLEDQLNAASPQDRHYRVLNMGVPSYNTVQELEQLKQVGQHLQADAAFLFIIPNDLQDKLWVLSKRSSFFIDMSQRSYALGLIFYAGRWVMNAAGLYTNPTQSISEAAEATAAEVALLDGKGWQDIERSLLEIHAILEQQGVPLLVFHRSQFEDVYKERMQALGRDYGFPVRELDVFLDPRWENIDRATLVNSPVDSHCNKAGCALYAQRMRELLEEEGLLANP